MQNDISTRWGTGQRSDPNDIREHLIVCANKCYQALGIFQTTIVDVATAATISSQTVLKHFGGRTALLNGVIVRDLEQLWAHSIEPLKSHAAHDEYLLEALMFALDYATMLLMAGVNINWVASQLGNSPLMVATVYAKWINGQADLAEMAKLNTRAISVDIKNDSAEKNQRAIDEKNEIAEAEKYGIGRELGEKNLRTAQIIEFKR